MGRRSAGETIACILLAFMREPVWAQAELALHCKVDARALRARLVELQAAGFPLIQDREPPKVYWTVPRGWFPGGRALSEKELKLAARLVRRLPEGAAKHRVLGFLEGAAASDTYVARSRDLLEAMLVSLEDALQERRVVEVDYFSASRGLPSQRWLSIQRIFPGERARVIAICHRSGRLQTFRVDRFRSVQEAPAETFRAATEGEIEAEMDASVNWYRAPTDAVLCRFIVRMPEAHWIRSNLPVAPFTEDHGPDGIRFEVHTAGVDVLARFVVGLGSAAKAETKELQQAVVALALGALDQAGVKAPKSKRKAKARAARG
ncbi:MAG: hypothetical protein JWN04_4767 [Myxococcaceae bacterium]|nr:hypothetical protein [Myxococcaceae bacterium]